MAIGRISGQMLKSNLLRSGTDLAFETTLLVLDVTNSRVGVGTASPATTFHISATDALRLPSGSDAQRPGTPANGDIRYNTDGGTIEGYAGGAWANLASGTELKDADEDTKVDVEPSSDLDEIHFTIAGTKRAKIAASTIELGVTGVSTTASTITSLTTNGDITFTPNGTGNVVVTSGSTFQTDTADINGGAIDAVTIGSNSAATALVANGGINIDDDGDGAMDGVVIGGSTAAAGTFTDLTVTTNVDIDDSGGDGAMDGVVIGANTAAAGTFTTLTTTGNATIGGDLTVNGTTTTIDSQTLVIEDPLLTLAKNNSGGSANTFDQGLFFNRGSDDNVSFLWDESADEFVFAVTSGEDGTTAGNVTIDSYANIHFNNGDVNKLTFDGLTIEDASILGTTSNQNIEITPSGTGSVAISKVDIAAGEIDGTTIGANSAAAGTFTNLTSTGTVNLDSTGNIDGITIGASSAAAGTFTTATATNVQATNIKANDGTAAIVIADSTGVVTVSTNVEVDGGNFTFNETGAAVDFRIEGDSDTHLFFADGSADKIGISTAAPAYVLDASGSTDAFKLPTGNTAARPTADAGIIRFNSQTGKYEGCQDGSTYVEFAIAGDTPIFSKVSATGDGSTTTFTGFFGSAPANANNVFVYIDNVYQEPTENYSVSSTNITFTSAPHSGARIFAITGADNTALASGGIARSESSSVDVSGSSATTIMSFNATSYRAAECFIIGQDSGNTNYEVAKALIVHDGTTAYVTVYGQTSDTGANLAEYTVTLSGGSVNLQSTPNNSGTIATTVQYSLAS